MNLVGMVLAMHNEWDASMICSFPCGAQMIAHSKSIPIVLLVDMFALLSYNYAGMCVTGDLSSHAHVG